MSNQRKHYHNFYIWSENTGEKACEERVKEHVSRYTPNILYLTDVKL